MDEATAAAWRAEARSKVAFDIEDVGHGVVKLTVTHDGFAPGSAVLPAISEGWPAVLASLKTLLENGVILAHLVNGRGKQQHRSRALNHSPAKRQPGPARGLPRARARRDRMRRSRGRLSVCSGSRSRLAPPERHSASAGCDYPSPTRAGVWRLKQ